MIKSVEGLIARLMEMKHEGSPVVLIVGGTTYPIDDVWFEPRQNGTGAVCIGDDPR